MMRLARAIRLGCKSSKLSVKKLAVNRSSMLRLWRAGSQLIKRWDKDRRAGLNKDSNWSVRIIWSYRMRWTSMHSRLTNVRTCSTKLRRWWKISMLSQIRSMWTLQSRVSSSSAQIKKWMTSFWTLKKPTSRLLRPASTKKAPASGSSGSSSSPSSSSWSSFSQWLLATRTEQLHQTACPLIATRTRIKIERQDFEKSKPTIRARLWVVKDYFLTNKITI